MKSINDRVIMVVNYLKCIWRLADMEERGGVLVQNEKQANKSVAKVMRITFLIFSIVFLLNVLGIFVVDMKIMAIAAIFTMLCERTAGMLSNLMNAEEQEQMIQNIKAMHKKSQETSSVVTC